jgi:spore germination cell wall hydrolase CwlJ-like protein
MQNFSKKIISVCLALTLALTTLFTTAFAYEAAYPASMTPAQLQANYQEVLASLESSSYTLQQKIDLLVKEQDKFHAYAEEIRAAGQEESRASDIKAASDAWFDADAKVLSMRKELEESKRNTRYDSIAATITPAERKLVAQILYLEAGNQSIEGQQAVVEVIFNRVINSRFPNSITSVLYQKNQFTSVKALSKAKPSATQYQVVDDVLAGKTNVLPSNVVYFSRGQMNNRPYKKIGAHWFCYI